MNKKDTKKLIEDFRALVRFTGRDKLKNKDMTAWLLTGIDYLEGKYIKNRSCENK